jgi:hypothetical protein
MFKFSYKLSSGLIERDSREFATFADVRGFASAAWRQMQAQSVAIYKDGVLCWIRIRGLGTTVL